MHTKSMSEFEGEFRPEQVADRKCPKCTSPMNMEAHLAGEWPWEKHDDAR
jgi:hypothetical protein